MARVRVVCALLLATLVVAAPGLPADAGAPVTASAPASAPAGDGPRLKARIVFVKNYDHPWRSEVVWRVTRRQADGDVVVRDRESWRAGSGFGGESTTDSCVKNVGWLPDGRYRVTQHANYQGSLIHGRAFFLGAKECHDGTLRTDLFLHTETGDHNQQCADRPGDQICRWEAPKVNDWRSHGCIKMDPASLLQLTRHFHRWFETGIRYPARRVSLVVR